MQTKTLALGLLALAAAAAAPSRAAAQTPAPTSAIPLDRIVGVVGARPITWYELQERINLARQEGGQVPTDSAAFVAYARTVLNAFMDEEVLVQKAAELKVELTDADVNTSVDRQFNQVRGRFQSEQEFRAQLRLAGLGTPEEYRRYLTEQIRRSELQRRVVDKLKQDGKLVSNNVTEAELQEAFTRAKSNLPRRPAQVTLRQIVLNPQADSAAKAKARVKAESLLAELRAGGDFASIAKRESMDPSNKDIGGDLGWQRRGQFVAEFERWIFPPYGLNPGQLSPVVETPFGYHIIRVDRVQPGEVKSRHILIRPVVDSADVSRAGVSADSIATALRAGASFDTLAKRFHDFANGEVTSILTPFPMDSLPESYRTALANKAPQDIVVFRIPGRGDVPKFVAAQLLTLTPEGEYTLAEMRERIRDQLQQEGAIRRLLDNLRRQTYIAVRLDGLPAPTAAAPQP